MKPIFLILTVLFSLSAFSNEASSDFDKACAKDYVGAECLKLGHQAYTKKDCYKVKLNLAKACDEGDHGTACHMVGTCGIFAPKGSEEHKVSKARLTKACTKLNIKLACEDLKQFGN
jgi:hypothetical protein